MSASSAARQQPSAPIIRIGLFVYSHLLQSCAVIFLVSKTNKQAASTCTTSVTFARRTGGGENSPVFVGIHACSPVTVFRHHHTPELVALEREKSTTCPVCLPRDADAIVRFASRQNRRRHGNVPVFHQNECRHGSSVLSHRASTTTRRPCPW